jgi:hypothetical protein
MQRSCGIRHALCVISAGVGNHTAAALFVGKGGNFVVRAAKLERSDRLEILELQEKAAVVRCGSIQ